MDISMTLAKIIGLYGLIVSVSALLNKQHLNVLVNEFLESEALMYLAALIALIIGLLLITFHNIIAPDYRLIITLFGWGSFIKGVLHLMVPEMAHSLSRGIIQFPGFYTIMILGVMVASLWLLKEGFAIQI